MAGNKFSQTYGPALAGGAAQVSSQFLGQALIDCIRKQFPRQKVQRGDAYMDGVRYMLRTDIDLIITEDRPKIELAYGAARGMKSRLTTHTGSKIRKFLQAREYKCECKKLFVVVKLASDRGVDDSILGKLAADRGFDDSLLAQIRREMGGTGPDPPDTSNGPPAAPFTGSSVNALDEVEMTTFRSEITGDVAVTLTLRGKDGKEAISQDVFTRFSPKVLTDDENADHKGPSFTLVPIDESTILGDHAEADEER